MQWTGQPFPAGHCLKNSEDKSKSRREVIPGSSSKPVYSRLGIWRVVLLQFFPEILFFICWEGMCYVCTPHSDRGSSNQGEELHAGTGNLREAVSLQG